MHLDLNYSRSWFQTPNAYDNLNVSNVVSGGTSANPTFGNVGNADQHSKIDTYNISPTYTHVIGNNSVFNLGAFARRDEYDYDPSANPLADLGPSNLQTSSISQYRTLTNTGIHADYSYVKGVTISKSARNTSKPFCARTTVSVWWSRPTIRPACAITGVSLPGYATSSQCNGLSNVPNANYLSVLAPYDLTRGGTDFNYFGHADVKELALYIEDDIKAGNWDFNLGVREDKYSGLTDANQT